MRPLELTIEGLRSFRRPETIEFSERELVAIVGDTGAGKSSILEAMTWALYGNATWTKQAGVLLGDGCPHMRVRLLFEADGSRWLVTRALKRRQDGAPGPSKAELVCVDGDRPAVDNVRQVNSAVARLLGLDWDAFTRTVVLPQGQFARLLTETDSDRLPILAQIWRTDEIVGAREQADVAHRELEAHLSYLGGRRGGYPADIAKELTAARKARTKANEASTKLENAVKDVERGQKAVASARQIVNTIAKISTQLRGALAGNIVTEASEVVARAANIDKLAKELDESLTKHERRLKALERRKDDTGPDREATRTALTSLEHLTLSLGDMADQMRSVVDFRSEALKRTKDAEDLKKAVDKADAQLAKAEKDLDTWRRLDAAATAAHGLHPGDDCPICARVLGADWKHPDASGLEAADERHRLARDEAREARDDHREKLTQAAELKKHVEKEEARLAKTFHTFRDAVSRLPEPFRPVLPQPFTPDSISPDDLTEALLADARSAAAQREESFVAWETELGEARQELHGLRDGQLDLQRRMHVEVAEPSEKIRRRLERISERVREYEEAGIELVISPPSFGEGVERLDADASEVVKAAESAIEVAESAIKAAESDVAVNEAELARLLTEMQAESVEELADRRVVTRAEAIRAQEKLDELERDRPIVEALDQHLEDGRAKLGALSDLKTVLQDGRFIRWLTLRRSRALLAVASTLLGEITGGRYAFADITDEHDEWRIFDNETGYARSPRTLSGGESFVASLALALGMVEMVARSGGRLEALFLDEGFGALDPENLDAAIDALESSATRGRMVAVITHVPAVAERLVNVLAVQRSPSGSQANWLGAADRASLATSDAAESIRDAMK